MSTVQLYDTTLRDGAQSEGISFSVVDKLHIARKLDGLGIHYIEGGWPGSNPKDTEFFNKAKSLSLSNSVLVAFGSTRYPGAKAESDANLLALVNAGVRVATIVKDSPADRAGLKPGDFVASFDHKRLVSPDALVYLLARVQPKSTYQLEVVRSGQTMTLPVTGIVPLPPEEQVQF